MKNHRLPRSRLLAAAVAVLVAACMPGLARSASAQANLADMVTFGDSLTHNDLLGLINGKPQELFGDDPNEAAFIKGAQPGEELTSYAIGGSESSDVAFQISLYETARLLGIQDKATIFGFEIGANDILNNLDLLASFAPGQNPTADAIIDDLIANMRRDLLGLRQSHRAAQFILWTIPDVTLTPALWGLLTTQQQRNLRAHTQRVNRLIRLTNRHPQAVAVDVFRVLRRTIAQPPILRGQQLVGPPAFGDFDHLFGDEIHPTAVSNALLANEIIQRINESFGDTIPLYSEDELADLAHIP